MEVEGHGLRATPLLCKQGCTRVARGGLTLVQRGGPSRRRQEGSGRAPSSGEGGACFLPSPPRSKAPPAALSSLGSSFLTGSDLWGGGFVVPISALKTCLMNERNNVIIITFSSLTYLLPKRMKMRSELNERIGYHPTSSYWSLSPSYCSSVHLSKKVFRYRQLQHFP